jgi:hypothetical protein
MKIIALVFAMLMAAGAYAQTPAGQYELGAGYSSVAGPTNNGTYLTFSKQFSPRAWGAMKGFVFGSLNGVTYQGLSPRYRPPLSALWKPSVYLDTTKFFPFVDLNLGAVKDTTGAMSFAYGIGVGLDYQVDPTVTLLAFEYDRLQSKFLPHGGANVTANGLSSITAGIKFNF